MEKQRRSGLRVVIIVLAVLLGVSLVALAGTIIYGHYARSLRTDTVPNSVTAEIITENPVKLAGASDEWDVVSSVRSGSTKLALYKNHAAAETPFHVSNMFPGDQETKEYNIEVSYRGTLTVHYHADIRPGYEKLAEVLKCKIIVNGAELYDGLMRDMPTSADYQISSRGRTTEELIYDITVYLDTSVGNPYQDQKLVADFRWWVEVEEDDGGGNRPGKDEETEVPSASSSEPSSEPSSESPSESVPESEPAVDPDEDGELISPPATGDTISFALLIALVSLIFVLFLVCKRKREAADEE